MNIGIDARLMSETGVGRYIRNLISGLEGISTNHRFFVYLSKKGFESFIPASDRFIPRLADVHWHTASEQVLLPKIFMADRLDVLHEPYVSIPIFYPGRMVVTVHDLTLLTKTTGLASRLPKAVYTLKKMGLRTIMSRGLSNATKIIAVSRATADDIVSHYPRTAGKITVISEGVDEQLIQTPIQKPDVPQPYFLAVGNAYPHKNLAFLCEAFVRYREKSGEDIRLVLAGREDYFYRKLAGNPSFIRGGDHILRVEPETDTQLANLYRGAEALVFPSAAEGFGLPIIESLALGTPVLCSDIAVFREVAGTHATYIPVGDADAWAKTLGGKQYRKRIPVAVSEHIIETYSWKNTARQTLDLYEHCTRL